MRGLVACAIVLGASFARTASACAVCSSGDRALSPAGSERPFAERVRLGLDARIGGVRLPDRELDEQRLEVAFAAAPTAGLLLGLGVPVLHRSLASSAATSRGWVMGDVELRATLAKASAPQSSRTALLLGLALPTAPLARENEAPLPVAFQPGCGSVVPSVGASFIQPFGALVRGELLGIGLYPLAARLGPHAGPSLRTSLRVHLQPHEKLALRAGLDARLEARGEFAPGASDPDSGGLVTWAAAQVVVSPMSDVVVSLGVLLPFLHQWTGARREVPVASFAVGWDL